mmetsp:Transcript_24334/g.78134  ORF Transcript_24334/g.78134 Transcript_24334/m.78134 type:complete len:419 (+) Transcript_24334:420-1676(+)
MSATRRTPLLPALVWLGIARLIPALPPPPVRTNVAFYATRAASPHVEDRSGSEWGRHEPPSSLLHHLRGDSLLLRAALRAARLRAAIQAGAPPRGRHLHRDRRAARPPAAGRRRVRGGGHVLRVRRPRADRGGGAQGGGGAGWPAVGCAERRGGVRGYRRRAARRRVCAGRAARVPDRARRIGRLQDLRRHLHRAWRPGVPFCRRCSGAAGGRRGGEVGSSLLAARAKAVGERLAAVPARQLPRARGGRGLAGRRDVVHHRAGRDGGGQGGRRPGGWAVASAPGGREAHQRLGRVHRRRAAAAGGAARGSRDRAAGARDDRVRRHDRGRRIGRCRPDSDGGRRACGGQQRDGADQAGRAPVRGGLDRPRRPGDRGRRRALFRGGAPRQRPRPRGVWPACCRGDSVLHDRGRDRRELLL